MAGTLKHAFTSAKADGTDSTKVRASNWNADHTFAGGALGSLLYRDTGATDGANWLADVAAGSYLRSGGVGAAPLWSTLTLPNSATAGDLMYASGANAIGSLADVATGSVLVSGGVGSAPAWSATPTLTDLTLTGVLKAANGTAAAPSVTFTSDPDTGFTRTASGEISITSNGAYVAAIGGASGAFFVNKLRFDYINGDVILERDAANVLAQRNGTNPQTFRIYNTFTDASNYERAGFTWSSNSFFIGTQNAGTGTQRGMFIDGSALTFRSGGTDRWTVTGSGHFTANTDNSFDIGASGANRPRDYYGAGKITSAGATAGIGYATGAGGTVTQLTSKATGVTLNKVTGQITLDAASLAATTAVSFTLTDSAIAATDLVALNHVSGGTAGAYAFTSTPAAGSTVITVRNLTAGALAEAIVIQFAVLKGVTS